MMKFQVVNNLSSVSDRVSIVNTQLYHHSTETATGMTEMNGPTQCQENIMYRNRWLSGLTLEL